MKYKKDTRFDLHLDPLEYFGFFLPFILRLSLMLSVSLTNSIFPYFFLTKVLFPLIDYLLPLDKHNRTGSELERLEKNPFYLIPLLSFAVLDQFFNLWLLQTLYYTIPGLSWYQQFIFLFVMGTSSGTSILAGHELAHHS